MLREDDRYRGRLDDQAHVALQWGQNLAEGSRSGGDLLRQALVANPAGLKDAVAADAETAGENGVARLFFDAVRLAGQERLVDFQPSALDQHTVDHHLVTRIQHEQVTTNQVGWVDLSLSPVTNDGGGGAVDQRDAIELAFGSCFLNDPGDDVEEDQPGRHHGVAKKAKRDEHDGDGEEEDVDEGDGVLANDSTVGAARVELDAVPLAACATSGDLLLAESLMPGDGLGVRLCCDHDLARRSRPLQSMLLAGQPNR